MNLPARASQLHARLPDTHPALATYLGHSSVVSTQYYLTFLQATAEAANERFHTHSAAWLILSAVHGGRRWLNWKALSRSWGLLLLEPHLSFGRLSDD